MTRPTDPFYHTDRFKIEWLDDPENGGVKSDCGRFRITPLPVFYRYGRFGSRCSVHPVQLFDKNPPGVRRHLTTYNRRADALRDAEFRRRQDE